MATWRDVCELAAGLPDVEESTTYRKPALKVRGKVFAWMSPHADALALRVEPDERPLMLESQPDVYYVTPHYVPLYQGTAIVLARLEALTDREELRSRLEDAWLLVAPEALARQYAARGAGGATDRATAP